MRIRTTTTGSLTSTTNTRIGEKRTSCTNAWFVDVTVLTYSGTQTVKTIKDVLTPGFHRILRCGQFLPLNPVEITTTTEERIPSNGEHFSNKVGGCYRSWAHGPTWSLLPWSVSVPPVDGDIVDQVVNSAIAEAKEAVWDALTFIGELRQVHRMLRGNFEGVMSFAQRAALFARRFHKGRKSSRKEILQTFTSKWLEYRYGWMPLIRDLESAVHAFESNLEKGDLVSGKGSVTTELNDSENVTTTSGPTTVTTVCTLTGSRIYRGKAYASVRSPEFAKFGADPLLTGWELVPFSFIVDWFIDVNSFIQAVSPFSGAELLGSMASVRDSYVLEQVTDVLWSGTESGSDNGRTTRITTDQYTRFPHGVSLPSWNPRITPVRLLDLAALIYQRRGEVLRSIY